MAVLHARAKELDTARELLDEALQRGGDEARTAAAGFPRMDRAPERPDWGPGVRCVSTEMIEALLRARAE